MFMRRVAIMFILDRHHHRHRHSRRRHRSLAHLVLVNGGSEILQSFFKRFYLKQIFLSEASTQQYMLSFYYELRRLKT